MPCNGFEMKKEWASEKRQKEQKRGENEQLGHFCRKIRKENQNAWAGIIMVLLYLLEAGSQKTHFWRQAGNLSKNQPTNNQIEFLWIFNFIKLNISVGMELSEILCSCENCLSNLVAVSWPYIHVEIRLYERTRV